MVILLSSMVLADNIYLYDSLQTRIQINGSLELIPTGNSPRVQNVFVDLFLYPQDDYRQQRVSLDSSGRESEKSIHYSWNDGNLGEKKYGYTAVVKTLNQRQKVKVKVPFPVRDVQGNEQYLQPTESIDSDNPKVMAKAAELAEGEDDLFKVSYKIASWVEQNVKYDLNTLTVESSQKASWVLENKEGVCDEMTSLFVAMMRSLGVPARFVSGMSYTTSDLFDENWQPHGWAEVYFPNIGWVSFDITFGEYGYIDVTHIKLRDGFDPTEPATEYQWTARDVNLTPGKLKINTEILRSGTIIPENIRLDQKIMVKEVQFGSYNLITGIMHNTQDYYAAATLQLAAPPDLEILGKNKRTILLAPQEIKETFWIVKVDESLNPQYQYTFPLFIYSEQNTTAEGIFKASSSGKKYSQEEIEQLTVVDEEKTYSQEISFACTYAAEIEVGAESSVECSLKNQGNTNLEGVEYCVGDHCQRINLLINQHYNLSTALSSESPGWKKVLIKAQNELIEKKTSLDYAVLDQPGINLEVEAPDLAQYGTNFEILLRVNKTSFNSPKQLEITIKGDGFQNTWSIEELTNFDQFVISIDGRKISYENKYIINARWQDAQGKNFLETREIEIKGEGKTLSDKMRMILNTIAGWFY